MKRILISISLIACMIFSSLDSTRVDASVRLSEAQERTADRIAEICTDNYAKYGVLPSVCVAQAFIESTLGEHCSGYNLWGISSGREHFSSLESGVKRYLEVINNGYYEGAPFEKDYRSQIRKILDGGYCQPEGNYYNNATWAISKYGFDKYDERLFKKLKAEEKRRQKKKKRQEYIDELGLSYESVTATCIDDPDLSPNTIYVSDPGIASGGCAMVYTELAGYLGIYDIQVIDSPNSEAIFRGSDIASTNVEIVGDVDLKIFENAKG